MILSYHPCFNGDKNNLCAGRQPTSMDLEDIQKADVVILPQGCLKSLYNMARETCRHVFPNYDAMFNYPGKLGQIELFRETKTLHPDSTIFTDLKSFLSTCNFPPKVSQYQFPFVFKFNWGGEGSTVYLIESMNHFKEILDMTKRFEKTGQAGFLLQEYIPDQNRVLRVVVIGKRIISYWRVKEKKDTFQIALAKGAVIDHTSDSDIQEKAREIASDFCDKTFINLAGFDFLFANSSQGPKPLFLEINYFFGRRGLGGSQQYYTILNSEIQKWLKCL